MDKNFASVLKGSLKTNTRQLTMVMVLVVIGIVFSILTDGTFSSARNLSNLMLQSSSIGILAICMALILVAGHIDLSVGAMLGFVGAISAALMVYSKWDTVPTIIVTLLIGATLGCWQGYWVAFRGVPSFIVTLAGMMMYRGGILVMTNGATISPVNESYKMIGQGYAPGIFATERGFNDTALYIAAAICIIYIITVSRKRKSRRKYNLEVDPIWLDIIKTAAVCAAIMVGMSVAIRHLGMPYAFIMVIALATLLNFIANNTMFGRYIYAIGGNKDAASMSGINIKKNVFMLFVLMGTMVAISSVVYTARLNSGTVSAGVNMELDAIASAIIGGTSTMGGEGSVFGAIIGALIITSIDNGMSIMNLTSQYQYIVKGLVLLLAVWMDISMRRKGKV